MSAERPPYRLAAGVAGLVLLGYILTLAPTVTLWDAGEFITAAHTLGIPHPPGTPLFVMMGHVWGLVVPVGAYAVRLNLMSAVFSAAGAGCLFLVAHRLLAGESPMLQRLGALGATIAAAFCFTVWQNSNETEVYAIATAMMSAMTWLVLRWRDTRDPRLLLMIVYLNALSIGNHLLALLAGPAIVAFVAFTLWRDPAADLRTRNVKWAEWGVLAASWLVLLAVGLGWQNTFWKFVLVLAILMFLGAAVWSATERAALFPAMVLLVAAAGVSTYAFLYIRAGLDPVLNEADPSTWHNLLAVIRREQYPVRSPLDNPMFESGAGNPGRTVLLMLQQLANYLQYFEWQWSRSIAFGVSTGPTLRLVFAVLFFLAGAFGLRTLWERDRGGFTLLGTFWLVTGLGLVAYMNFKPGFSLFWDRYTSIDHHEVRERDYFFIASFQAWGLFAGIGLAMLARRLALTVGRWALVVLALALIPVAFNWRAATRRGPDAQLGRDFAWDLLQSVGPYGVLFTYGDNDTFPVWYLQEVEGVRQDVVLVNLSLANTDWYLDQMRRHPQRPFDRASAPAVWQNFAVEEPRAPVLIMPDSVFRRLGAFQQQRDVEFMVHDIPVTMRRGQSILPRDLAILYILDAYAGRRPIGFGISSGQGEWLGFDRSLLQRGLAYWIVSKPENMTGMMPGVNGNVVDTTMTRLLARDVYRYAGLFDVDTLQLDPAARQLAASLARPYLELAQAAIVRHDQEGTINDLRRALHLMPNRQLAALLARVESEGLDALLRQQESQPQRR